jgi:hypothetical protein
VLRAIKLSTIGAVHSIGRARRFDACGQDRASVDYCDLMIYREHHSYRIIYTRFIACAKSSVTF